MSFAGLIQVVVIAALAASLVAKTRAQKRQGVGHSIVLGRAGDDPVSRMEPVVVPFIFLWFGTIALHGTGWTPGLFEPRLFRSPVLEGAGVVLALAGLALQLTSLHQMGRSWRIGIDPDSHELLVTTGVFGISRNPIYVALDLIAVSIVLMSGSLYFLVTGLLVMAGIHVQIHREEHFLAGAFGEEYDRYRARVPRYLGWRVASKRAGVRK